MGRRRRTQTHTHTHTRVCVCRKEGGREGKTVIVVEVEQERGKEEGRNGVCE